MLVMTGSMHLDTLLLQDVSAARKDCGLWTLSRVAFSVMLWPVVV